MNSNVEKYLCTTCGDRFILDNEVKYDEGGREHDWSPLLSIRTSDYRQE